MTKKWFSIQNNAGTGEIRIIGRINWFNNSEDFTAQVDQLINEGVQDLELYINSPGGDMFEGNEIGNQVKRFKGTKTSRLGALVASAATIISTYTDKVKASANTQYMIHDPSHVFRVESPDDFEANKKLYENLRENAIQQYVNKTGLDKDTIAEMMRKTTWMTANEAKEKGFIDEVAMETDSMPDDALDALAQMQFSVPATLVNEIQNSSIEPQNNHNPMKEIAKKLGLDENATQDQIINAIQTLTDQNTRLSNIETAAVDMIKAEAKEKGFDEKLIENLAKNDFPSTAQMVQGFNVKPVNNPRNDGGNGNGAPDNDKNTDGGNPNPSGGQNPNPSDGVKTSETGPDADAKRLSDLLKSAAQGVSNSQGESWTLTDWEQKDPKGLQEMIKNDFEKYAGLFKAKHGVKPSPEDFKQVV